MSVHGGVFSQGVSAPGGVCSRGVSAICPRGPGLGGYLLSGGGCLVPEGLVSQHALRQTPLPGETATAADGTHPTSYKIRIDLYYYKLLEITTHVTSNNTKT